MNPYVSAFREAIDKSPTEQRLRAVKKALDEIHGITFNLESPPGYVAPNGRTIADILAGAVQDVRQFEVPEAAPYLNRILQHVQAGDHKQAKRQTMDMQKALRETRKALEEEVRAEQGRAKRQAREEKEAAKTPVTPSARRSTHSGTCQFCGRLQKLPGNGVDLVAKHGYEVRWSEFHGSCPGSDRPPYEQTCDDLKRSLAGSEMRAKEARAEADSAKPPGPADPMKDKKEYAALQSRAKQFEQYVAFLKQRIADWKPGTLRPHS